MRQIFIRIIWVFLTFLTALLGVVAILSSADMSYGILNIIPIILGTLLIMASGGLIVIQVIIKCMNEDNDK